MIGPVFIGKKLHASTGSLCWTVGLRFWAGGDKASQTGAVLVNAINQRIVLHRTLKAQGIVYLGYEADICHGCSLAKAILTTAVKGFKVVFQRAKTLCYPVAIPMQFVVLIQACVGLKKLSDTGII